MIEKEKNIDKNNIMWYDLFNNEFNGGDNYGHQRAFNAVKE